MMVREIALSRGLLALVDDDHFDALSRWTWHATSAGYAARWAPAPARRQMILMHRDICEAPTGSVVDHIDRNRLNNQRHNLRVVTWRENSINRQPARGSASGFRGVCWDIAYGKWAVSIGHEGRNISIGRFDDPIYSAQLYDAAARELHGPFALLNFPEVDLSVDWRNPSLDLRGNNTSGYRGVSFHERIGRWQARATIQGRRVHLGYFDTPEVAAEAHDEAIVTKGGDLRRLNFPDASLFGVSVDGGG